MSDPIGNPEAFPILRHWDFFNHAGVCPLPRVAADALRKYAEQAETVAYVQTGWYREIEKLRVLSAQLINAHRDEIAFIKNTSEGIATVANAIDWKPGDRIVTTAVEYPANMYPWMDAANRFGAEVVSVPEEESADGARRVSLDRILAEAAHPRTRLVALSHVEFASGQRLDIAKVGAFCREHGKLFCVDAIQSMGVIPVDVQAMKIDYLSADGHKWLLGPEGAGIFYCRRELLATTRPLIVGWMNVINAEEYGNYDFTLKPDARKFECGSWNVPGLLALKASLELLLSVGIDSVGKQIRLLTERLIEGLRKKGYRIVSPREGDEWSGIVSFVSPVHDHAEIFRTLRGEHKTEIALREKRLRVSPHFYNTVEQIDRLVERLPGHPDAPRSSPMGESATKQPPPTSAGLLRVRAAAGRIGHPVRGFTAKRLPLDPRLLPEPEALPNLDFWFRLYALIASGLLLITLMLFVIWDLTLNARVAGAACLSAFLTICVAWMLVVVGRVRARVRRGEDPLPGPLTWEWDED